MSRVSGLSGGVTATVYQHRPGVTPPGMQSIRHRRSAATVLTILSIPLAGADQCDQPHPLTTIHYEQLGVCTYDRDADSQHSAPARGAAWFVFRVTAVDNTGTGADSVFVQPERFFPIGQSELYSEGDHTLGWQQPRPMTPHLVKAGTTATIRETFVIEVPYPGDGDPLGAAVHEGSLHLAYRTVPNTQGVLLVKDNDTKVQWKRFEGCFRIELEPNQGAS
jgi:hypothetical protein